MKSRIGLFILIGLFLYIVDYRFSYDEDLNQIIIPDDEILGLIDTWRDQVGRDPSDEEIVRIINNLVNEEILYREALKLELDKNDRIIKRRLAQKVEFLKQDDIQPSPADIENFYVENKSKYMVEDLFTFKHHFFSEQDNSDIRAKESLIKISNGFAVDSDPFILGNDLNLMSKSDLQQNFGVSFYESLTLINENQWSGPISSYYGLHIVFIKKKIDGYVPRLNQIYQKVYSDYLIMKRRENVINFLDEIKQEYEVIINPDLSFN
jgi:parvulin-like peptidyl-prolyl isomerase